MLKVFQHGYITAQKQGEVKHQTMISLHQKYIHDCVSYSRINVHVTMMY